MDKDLQQLARELRNETCPQRVLDEVARRISAQAPPPIRFRYVIAVAVAASVVVGEADAGLLEALKALRTKLAQVQKVPAYVVFSDRTLVELATHRPASPRAMREIHGVGDTKLERYGAAFLEVVQTHPR